MKVPARRRATDQRESWAEERGERQGRKGERKKGSFSSILLPAGRIDSAAKRHDSASSTTNDDNMATFVLQAQTRDRDWQTVKRGTRRKKPPQIAMREWSRVKEKKKKGQKKKTRKTRRKKAKRKTRRRHAYLHLSALFNEKSGNADMRKTAMTQKAK